MLRHVKRLNIYIDDELPVKPVNLSGAYSKRSAEKYRFFHVALVRIQVARRLQAQLTPQFYLSSSIHGTVLRRDILSVNSSLGAPSLISHLRIFRTIRDLCFNRHLVVPLKEIKPPFIASYTSAPLPAAD